MVAAAEVLLSVLTMLRLGILLSAQSARSTALWPSCGRKLQENARPILTSFLTEGENRDFSECQ